MAPCAAPASPIVRRKKRDPAQQGDRWGRIILLTLTKKQAEHLVLSPQNAAEKFTTVEVPTRNGTLGWQWHPVLGLIEVR